ncbi:MAG: D-glycero-beta-D-manno-heptose 1-phosphate adenylyltransferase [Candidatus Aminicenantes bacterium]|nr:D-glycero-beta-D-manno-heptose 1-phosphate adenylyltransferase [Candidatus Aminicenantes bacterium]
MDIDSLKDYRCEFRRQGKRVVFTNGCFDILHAGHIHLFREAKNHGEVLIVAVNDDASVRKLKGPSRPVFPLSERLEVLEAVADIDYLIPFAEDTPRNLVRALLPEVLLKGGDWRVEEVVGREEVEGAGGRVVIVSYLPGKSTSAILEQIARLDELPDSR